MKKPIASAVVVASLMTLTGCSTNDAEVASYNLSKAADMFEINRRVVFMNGITDTYMLSIEGRCSIKRTISISSSCSITNDIDWM